MSNFSAIHAPATHATPRLRSARDIATLVAIVVALGLVAHLAAPRPRAAGVTHAAATQDIRR